MNKNKGIAIIELIVVFLILSALLVISAPNFVHMKTNARIQALIGIANNLDNNSRFIRAVSYENKVLHDNDQLFTVCMNGYKSDRCNKLGFHGNIVSTDMVLVQRGFPYSFSNNVLAVVSLLGYRYNSTSNEELIASINQDIPILPTCDGLVCNLAEQKTVCEAPLCLQGTNQGTLILQRGVSASDQCYVSYFHGGEKTPKIEIVSKGC